MKSVKWFTVEQWSEDLNKWTCLFGHEDELTARRVYGVLQEASPNSKYRVRGYFIADYEEITTNEYEFRSGKQVWE